MTIKEQMEQAANTCTAMDLTKQLDRLKNSDGSVDYDKVEKLINQLNEFGPYYKGILQTIVANLK
jgi:hypothetical protein